MGKHLRLAFMLISLLLIGYSIFYPSSSAAKTALGVALQATATPLPTPTPGSESGSGDEVTGDQAGSGQIEAGGATPPSATVASGPVLTVVADGAPKLVTDVNGNGAINPGDTIQYTVTYKNEGNASATNVVIISTYDPTLVESVTNVTQAGTLDADTGQVSWELGDVGPGVEAPLTYDVTLTRRFPPGTTSVSHEVTITSEEATSPASDRQAFTVTVLPQLTALLERVPGLINDLNGNGSVDPGDTIRYKINYANQGEADATNVAIVASYDQTLTESVTNISGGGAVAGSQIAWQLDAVGPGDGASFTYDVTLKPEFPSGTTSVSHQVTITSEEETSPASDEQDFAVTVLPELITVLEKVPTLINDLNENGVIDPGDTVQYRITYSNEGDVSATNVKIVSDYDEAYVESVPNISDGGTDDGSQITWQSDSVGPGVEASLTYDATLTSGFPSGPTSVSNKVSITSKEQPSPTGDEQSFSVTVQPKLAIALEEVPSLIKDLNENGAIDPGDTIRHTITYQNLDVLNATEVQVVSNPDRTNIESIANISDGGMDDGNQITWQLDAVGPGVEASLSYDITLNPKFPPGPTSVSNKVSITSKEQPSPAGADQSFDVIAQPRLGVIAERMPGLIKDLNGNGSVDPGDTIRYKVTYANQGDADASGVKIVADYDENFVESVPDVSDRGANDTTKGEVSWELGAVEPGVEASLTYDLTLQRKFPLGATSVRNQVSITSKEEPSPVTDRHSFDVTAQPKLTVAAEGIVALDLNDNGAVDPGDTIRYRITYANQGDADASGVRIVADYDETFVESVTKISGGGANDGSQITWLLDTVGPGAETSLTYDAQLKQNLPEASAGIEHQATIDSNELDPVTSVSTLQRNVAPVGDGGSGQEDAAGGIFATQPIIPSVLIGLLAVGAMVVLTYVGSIAKFDLKITDADSTKLVEEQGKVERSRISLVREGTFLIFIIASILVLAISRGVEPDGAISILSAIVGYVFGRASSSSG